MNAFPHHTHLLQRIHDHLPLPRASSGSATQIAPTKAKYWRQLGLSLSTNPQWRKEAEDSFNKAMELEPSNPDNYLHLAFLYKNLGLRLRAKKYFQNCLDLDRTNELALREIAQMADLPSQDTHHQKKSGLGGMFKKK